MTHDLHTLTGAYALDALDVEERRGFEEHLATCESCAEEVTGLIATGAMLGSGVATTAPASLHRDVMAQVRATRQLTPIPGAGARGGADDGEDDGTVVRMVRRARAQSRALLAVAAALLVVAGTLGGVAVVEQRQSARLEQASSQMAAVIGAPDARLLEGEGPGSSGAQVVVSATEGKAVFVARDMPAPSDRALQLWVIKDGTFRSVGLIDGEKPLIADGVDGFSDLGVTIEPDGGSEQPTSAPVMKVSLA